jgi:exopolysaccharide biosynthesis protein
MSIGEPLEEPYNAVSGFSIFLKDGQVQEFPVTRYYPTQPSPRTAVALDRTREHFLIFVVDGRQPNYSEGVPLPELAEIAITYGADIALNLDGGGSSTLVKEGSDGKAVVLNSPVHLRVPPGRERPVANHLGIFAPAL